MSVSNGVARKATTTHRQVAITGLVPTADGSFRRAFDARLGADETAHTLLQLVADRVGAHAVETSATVLKQKV